MVKITETTIDQAVKFDDQNANQGTPEGQSLIENSIRERGIARPVVIGSDDGLIGSNQATAAAKRAGITKAIIIETAGDTLIVHKRTDVALDSPEGRTLAVEDNRIPQINLHWDPARVASFGVDVSHLWSPTEIATFAPPPPTVAPPPTEEEQQQEDELSDDDELLVGDIPDALFPTDNEWGVPVLDLNWMADAVDLPVNAWGSIGRKSKMNGTYHFYVDDYRFNNIWKHPEMIVNAGCVNVVEPNFSTNIQMPRAIVLWHVYRKRWLARYWQSQGIRVFVDLDINAAFSDISLLGVPEGWKSYACRMESFGAQPDELDVFLSEAKLRAGTDDVLLLVVGGNKEVQGMCQERPQCVYVPSFTQTAFKNVRQNTTGS